jgi:hypothetical protein
VAGGEDGDGGVVWVPPAPGPLVRPGGAARDGLDDLLDELLPGTEEGPGATDAALIAGGGAVVAWAVVGSPPVAAAVAGAVALGLGCILPVRSLWRWAAGRRRPAGGLGVPLRSDHHLLARLVGAYTALDAMAATPPEARGAAHGALLEVATLLGGRTPASDAEARYVAARAEGVERLVAAVEELEAGPVEGEGPAPELVVEAREELDALGGMGALARLDDVTADIEGRGRRP